MYHRRFHYSKKQKPFSRFAVWALVLLAVCIGFSLFASYFWVFDLFTHFIPHYTALSFMLFTLLYFSKRQVVAFVALGFALFGSYQLIPVWYGPDAQLGGYEEVRVLQYNVHRNNQQMQEIIRWIAARSEEVDVIVLQEVTQEWQEALDRIRWIYPYHMMQQMRGDRHNVVLSKLLINEIEVKYLGEAASPALVMRGQSWSHQIPFVLYSVHPPPPVLPSYAKRRNETLTHAAYDIAQEPAEHKLLIGDLNVTRYSPWFSKLLHLSGLRDGHQGQGLLSTWPSFLPSFLGLTIDHTLVSDNIYVADKHIGPAMGSDHMPVITQFHFHLEEGTDHGSI